MKKLIAVTFLGLSLLGGGCSKVEAANLKTLATATKAANGSECFEKLKHTDGYRIKAAILKGKSEKLVKKNKHKDGFVGHLIKERIRYNDVPKWSCKIMADNM